MGFLSHALWCPNSLGFSLGFTIRYFMIISLYVLRDNVDYKRNFPFKFNRAWLLSEDFSALVHSSWAFELSLQDYDAMSYLVQKLKRLKGEFRIWEKRQKETQFQALLDLEKEAHHIF